MISEVITVNIEMIDYYLCYDQDSNDQAKPSPNISFHLTWIKIYVQWTSEFTYHFLILGDILHLLFGSHIGANHQKEKR